MIRKISMIIIGSALISFANADVGSALTDYYNSLQANSKIEQPALTTNGFTAGGYYQRGANVDLTLGYVTPPSINGSCGNIDFNMGAFSFISGDQIVAALKAIGQSAKGLLFTEAIDLVSAELGGNIKHWIDEANKWLSVLKNSCQASSMLVGGLNKSMGLCQNANRYNNTLSDENTVQSTCQAADQGMAGFKSIFGSGSSDAKTALAPQISLQGGILQNMLANYFAQMAAANQFDAELGNIVLSLAGDVYTQPLDQNSNTNQALGNAMSIYAPLKLEQLFEIQLDSAADYVSNSQGKIYNCDFTWDANNFRALNNCFVGSGSSGGYALSSDQSIAGFYVMVNNSITKIHDRMLSPVSGGLTDNDLRILSLSDAPIFQIMQSGVDAGQDSVTWPLVQSYMTYAIHKIFFTIFSTISNQLGVQMAALSAAADPQQANALQGLNQNLKVVSAEISHKLDDDVRKQQIDPMKLLQQLQQLRSIVASNVSPTLQDKLAFSSSSLRNN